MMNHTILCINSGSSDVVMISILVHGMTVSHLLRWLGIVKGREHRDAYEFARGKLQAASAALEELERLSHVHFFRNDVRSRLKDEYTERIAAERGRMGALELDCTAIESNGIGSNMTNG
jgi:hypothetical protein